MSVELHFHSIKSHVQYTVNIDSHQEIADDDVADKIHGDGRIGLQNSIFIRLEHASSNGRSPRVPSDHLKQGKKGCLKVFEILRACILEESNPHDSVDNCDNKEKEEGVHHRHQTEAN